MNIAVVIAGGRGQRFGQDIPKQFVTVNDRPVLIYTLEAFQSHPDIDEIAVSCLEGWEEILKAYARQYQITKLKTICRGGGTVQESIYNGLNSVRERCAPEGIAVIHDGVRPLVSEPLISDCIAKCRVHGNGIASMPYYEQIFWIQDALSARKYISRNQVMRLQTPQAYRYGEILGAYEEAFSKGIGTDYNAYANTMMADLGHTLYFSAGSSKNIKITTEEDIEIFRALLNIGQ